MKFSRAKLSTTVASVSLAGALAVSAAPAAQADMIDRALNALPAGHISCEQANKYWTNTADYNNKVAQARAVAMFDHRGPQILSALQRVDEAANRCGLKGGNQAPVPQAPAQPGPARPAPAPQAPAVQLIPGAPVAQTVNVPNVGTFAIPDLWQMVRNWLAGFGIRI